MSGNTVEHVLKVDDTLGVVFGFAFVCNVNGEKHYDHHGDHISESVMLKSATDYMERDRTALSEHTGGRSGTVVFAFPLSEDIAKSLEIETKKTGMLIGMKPNNKEDLQKFRDGTYTGFSIGARISRQ